MLATLPLLAALLAYDSPPLPLTGEGTVVVYLADGSTVPLQEWSLAYEWVAWPKSSSPAFAAPGSRQIVDLWNGRRTLPVRGAVVEVIYPGGAPKRQDPLLTPSDGPAPPRATGLVVAQGKQRTELKAEAPPREFLAPTADKKVIVMARSLDIRGKSLTGTERVFCLISFSSTVQCAGTPADQVVRLEFSAATP